MPPPHSGYGAGHGRSPASASDAPTPAARPGASTAQLTVRAVAGMGIGAVMCLSNIYVFFKTG